VVGRIASYLVSNVQRSYMRQQHVGERIADAKAKDDSKKSPAEVDISDAARRAADEADSAAISHKNMETERIADRFVDYFLSPTENDEAGVPEENDPTASQTSLVHLIEPLGLEMKLGDDGKDLAIVNKESGDVLISLSDESHNTVKSELKTLVKNILNEKF